MKNYDEIIREAIITMLYTVTHLTERQKEIIMGCLFIGIGFLFLMPYREYAGPHLRYSLRGVVHATYGLGFIGILAFAGFVGELYGIFRLVKGLFM